MFTSRRKAAAVSALALAMTLGLAAPASATTWSLSSDKASLTNGELALLTTDVSTNAYVTGLFVNGMYVQQFTNIVNGATIPWAVVAPCETVDVTLRMYAFNGGFPPVLGGFDSPYAASVTIEFVGDTSVPCDATWGAGLDDGGGSGGSGGSGDSGEPLAKTGSDASTLTGLTGIAGVAALVVAAAVAFRLRRAQR
jgi:hypothetical protein